MMARISLLKVMTAPLRMDHKARIRSWLLVLSLSGMASGHAVANPVPGISDLPAKVATPVRIPFACPNQGTGDTSDIRRQTDTPEQTSRCYVVLNTDWINVMDRQRISRADVERIWETYTYRPNGLILRTWNLLYRLDGSSQKRILVLRDVGGFTGVGGLPPESISSLLHLWLQQ